MRLTLSHFDDNTPPLAHDRKCASPVHGNDFAYSKCEPTIPVLHAGVCH